MPRQHLKILGNPFLVNIYLLHFLILPRPLSLLAPWLSPHAADSFAATALFYLGFNMAGKMSSISTHDVYTLVVLLLAKL
ncbi:unnamed protein product [Protopolystoma xenopodis]|uniref:Uncharacterized protein n=1 Tax=Protopolystoma xenopodis TaxID=117903 RepID=A0A3S5AA23_9PLAT|nr:unnamed protein product [Protopolystoma xenopodis]